MKSTRKRELLVCAALVALTWIVFGQTLRFGYVGYDDVDYVLRTPEVARGLTLHGIASAFTHVHASNWHPLTTISHMLDRSLFGASTAGPHAINVALHSITAAVLFIAFVRLSGALWRSAFVAAAFAIHPLRAESVAWIAERKDVLSGLFFALLLLAYARFVRRRSLGNYIVVALVLIGGLLSKPMLVTAPFVLLLLDYWPLHRFAREPWRRVALEKLSLLCLSIGSIVATVLAQRGVIAAASEIPFTWRLTNAITSYAIYLRQHFWPGGLSILYLYRDDPAVTVIGCSVLLAAITIAAFAFRRRASYLLVGWLWFLGMLVPVIGIVQVGMQAHADRYTYLPSIGILLIIAWSIADFVKHRLLAPVVVSVGAIAILFVSAACSYQQVSVWRNSDTLWSHALSVDPTNDAAHVAYAEALFAENRTPEALAHLRKAVELRPSNAGRYGGGALGLDDKQLDAGIAFWAERAEERPNDGGAKDSLGALLIQRHRTREAIALWEQALSIDANDGNAQANLAWALATCPDDSVRDGNRALELAQKASQLAGGRNALVSRTLAAALAECGRFDEAVATARDARTVALEEGNTSLANDLGATIAELEAHRPLRDKAMQPARDLH